MNYIAFEGIDGLGKSTQIKLAASKLNAKIIAEPSALGASFKKLACGMNISPIARMFMFLADRAQLFSQLHAEDAFNKQIILSDRSLISHLAYALNSDMNELYKMNLLATQNTKPSAVVYFKADINLAASRLANKEKDALENTAYLSQVAANYEKVLEFLKLPTLIVDASLSIDEIHLNIMEFLKDLINKNS